MTFESPITPLGRGLLLVGTAAALTFGLTACGSKVLDYRNVTVAGGKIYAGDSDKPFSGKVTNVPFREASAQTPALDTILKAAADANKLTYYTATNWLSSLCDVAVSDGYRDGATVCGKPDSSTQYVEFAFSGGQLNGDVTLYSTTGSGKPAATATVSSGAIDGELKIYSVSNGAVIAKAKFKAGVLLSEEDFDANTGKTIRTFSDDDQGRIDGKMLGYSPDGTLVSYAEYNHGAETGEAYSFYPDTGRVKQCLDTEAPDVAVKWDEAGKLVDNVETETYDINTETATKPIPQSTIDACMAHMPSGTPAVDTLEHRSTADPIVDACVKSKTTSYLQERLSQGMSGLVSAAQESQWRQSCKQEKGEADGQATVLTPVAQPSGDGQTSLDACVTNWTNVYRKERGSDAMVSNDRKRSIDDVACARQPAVCQSVETAMRQGNSAS